MEWLAGSSFVGLVLLFAAHQQNVGCLKQMLHVIAVMEQRVANLEQLAYGIAPPLPDEESVTDAA